MKHNRFLCLLLALVILGGCVWYGSIAVLQKDSRVELVRAEGEDDALTGIQLHGELTDGTFSQRFTLEDGQLNNQFRPIDLEDRDRFLSDIFLNVQPAPGGNRTPLAETSEPDPNGLHYWELYTDRVRLYLDVSWVEGNESRHTVLDTGIELQSPEQEYCFQLTTHPEYFCGGLYLCESLGNAFPAHQIQPTANATEIDGVLYVTVNLPWGGGLLYRIDEYGCLPIDPGARYQWEYDTERIPDPEELVEYAIQPHSDGAATLLHRWDGDEASDLLAVYPLGDHLVVLAQTDAEIPCLKLTEENMLVQTDPAAESRLFAMLCDKDGQVVDEITLMDLDGVTGMLVSVAACAQPETGFDDLSLLVRLADINLEIPVTLAASLRMESERFTSVQTALYPMSLTARELGLDWTDDEPRRVGLVQPDETGTKLAVVWQSAFDEYGQGGDIFLDVLRDGKRLYRGELKSDWMDDRDETILYGWNTFNTSSWVRYFAFERPFGDSSNRMYTQLHSTPFAGLGF